MKWMVNKCTSNCSVQFNLNNSIRKTFGELFIPRQTLPYGLYQFELTVQSISSSNVTISVFAYVKINPSATIAVNFVPLGTSMITRGHEQDLLLDPGSYSLDPDQTSFNASVIKFD